MRYKRTADNTIINGIGVKPLAHPPNGNYLLSRCVTAIVVVALCALSGSGSRVAQAQAPPPGGVFSPGTGSTSPAAESISELQAQITVLESSTDPAAASALRLLRRRLDYLWPRAYPSDSVDWNAYQSAAVGRGTLRPAPLGQPSPLAASAMIQPFPLNQVSPGLLPSLSGQIKSASGSFSWQPGVALPPPPIDSSSITAAQSTPTASAGAAVAGPSTGASWQFAGPVNLVTSPYFSQYAPGAAWAWGIGSMCGRVNTSAFDPNNPNVIYVGAAAGGLWKGTTTDGGYNWSWSCLSDGIQNPSNPWVYLQVSSIAIDPRDSRTIYVGTGDFPGQVGYSDGLLKTTDGGATWTSLNTTVFNKYAISKVIVDPIDYSIVVATGRGSTLWGDIWVYSNGSWNSQILASGGAPTVWCDVKYGTVLGDGSRYYYAVGYDQNGVRQVWRARHSPPVPPSTTGSWSTWSLVKTWTGFVPYVNPGLPPTYNLNYDNSLIDIAASATDPDTVYVIVPMGPPAYAQSSQHVYKGVYSETLQTWTWTDITGTGASGLPYYLGTGDFQHINWSQSYYDLYLTAVPSTGSDVLYAGLLDIDASYGAGGTWSSINHTYTGNDLAHTDQHSLVLSPFDNSVMLAANDGGVYAYNSGNSSFTSLNSSSISTTANSLGITQFYRAAFDPANPNKILAGAQDNGSPASIGDLNNWHMVSEGDGGWCAINPSNPNRQYSSQQSNAYTDQYGRHNLIYVNATWDSWGASGLSTGFWQHDTAAATGVPDVAGFEPPMVMDPSDPTVLYIATNYLWQFKDAVNPPVVRPVTPDETPTWTALPRTGFQPNESLDGFNGGYVSSMAAARGLDGPTTTRIYTGSVNGHLRMSDNGGQTWTAIDASLPVKTIMSIAVNPNNKNQVIIGMGGTTGQNLWLCNDTTAASPGWIDITGNLYTSSIMLPINTVAFDPYQPNNACYIGTDAGAFYTNNYTAGAATIWTNTAPGLPSVQVNDLEAVPGTSYLNAATYGRGLWRVPLTPLVETAGNTGNNWNGTDVAVGSDSKTRLLWGNGADAREALWSVDNSGSPTYSYVYGPYSGWTPRAVSSAPGGTDGLSRLLWTNTSGAAAIYLMGSTGTFVGGANFGPYAGWTATDLAVANDNTSRLLWNNQDGSIAIYVLNASGGFAGGQNYPAYSGWTAKAIAVGNDGKIRLLWTSTSGQVGLWIINSDWTTSGYIFGPYPYWTATDVTVGSDNKARILWVRADGAAGLWTVDNSGLATNNGTVYGPFPNWTASRVAAGADGYSHLLWYNADHSIALYLMNSSNVQVGGVNFGPY